MPGSDSKRLAFRIDTSEWERFAPTEGTPVPKKRVLEFTATKNRFITILKVFTVDDTVAILSAGVVRDLALARTAHNGHLTEALVDRRVDPREFLEVYRTGGGWEIFSSPDGVLTEREEAGRWMRPSTAAPPPPEATGGGATSTNQNGSLTTSRAELSGSQM